MSKNESYIIGILKPWDESGDGGQFFEAKYSILFAESFMDARAKAEADLIQDSRNTARMKIWQDWNAGGRLVKYAGLILDEEGAAWRLVGYKWYLVSREMMQTHGKLVAQSPEIEVYQLHGYPELVFEARFVYGKWLVNPYSLKEWQLAQNKAKAESILMEMVL